MQVLTGVAVESLDAGTALAKSSDGVADRRDGSDGVAVAGRAAACGVAKTSLKKEEANILLLIQYFIKNGKFNVLTILTSHLLHVRPI